jgi:hypothetical protein
MKAGNRLDGKTGGTLYLVTVGQRRCQKRLCLRRDEGKLKQVTLTFEDTSSRVIANAEMLRGTDEPGVTSLLALTSAQSGVT